MKTAVEAEDPTLYAYYPLLSDFRDYSGNGRHAKPYEHVEFSDGLVCPGGVTGGCITPINLSGADNFSIELMVYKYTSDTTNPAILDHRHAGPWKGFVCHKNNGVWYFGFSNQSPAGESITLDNSKFPRNMWLRVIFKVENRIKQSVRITQSNGLVVLDQQMMRPSAIVLDSSTPFVLGSCFDWPPSRGLSGRIKEAKINVW